MSKRFDRLSDQLAAPVWNASRSALWVAAFAVAAALPLAIGAGYHITLLTNLLIKLPFTLSLNYVIGRLGLFSMAHGAFLGIGAYVGAIVVQRAGISPWLALPLSVGASAALAALIGVAVLRLKGLFLAVATLAFALFVEVFVRQNEFTGGAYGITSLPPLTVLGTPVQGVLFYELALVLLFLVAILFENIKHARFGRAGYAAQDNEAAAAAAGINVARVRLAGFTISAGIAGLAGWMYAFFHGTVNPFLFSLDLLFVGLFMVLIGGLGSMLGVAIGTALLSLGPEIIGFATTQQVLATGVLVLVVVLVAPRGIGGLIEEAAARRRARRGGAHVQPSTSPAA